MISDLKSENSHLSEEIERLKQENHKLRDEKQSA
jgi:cell division protein FtsB